MKGLLPDASEPFRRFRAEEQRRLAAICDAIFRVTEMLLVCGAVVYLEGRASSPPVASGLLSACVAIYARGRLSAAVLDTIEKDDTSDAKKRLLHWIASGIAFGLFITIITFTPRIVAIIVANQH